MDDSPKMVLTVTVCLLLLAIGIFVITIFVDTTDLDVARVETFAVTDPSVDLTVTLQLTPAAKPTVEQWNGISWVVVVPADVEWSGARALVIENEGMQG